MPKGKTRRAVYFNKDQKNAIIRQNMGMITKIVNKFYHSFQGMDNVNYDVKQDLVQEGVLGLLKSLERYDPDKGVKISSFAYYFIFSAIQSFVAANFGVCRQPHTKISNNFANYGDSTYDSLPEESSGVDFDVALDGEYEELYARIAVLPSIEQACLLYAYGITKELDQKLMPLCEFLANNAILRLRFLDDNINV